MAKKSILTILPIAIGALLVGGLASCGNNDKPVEPPIENPDDGTKETFTVNFRDGDTVLETLEVEKDTKVTAWDPSTKVTDKDFFGWYAEPTLKHAFDFDTLITADTEIFGSFVGYQKDTRKWAIAGSGTSSLLKSSSWGTVYTEKHYMANESTDKENIFTMTLSLFKGDQFQFTDPQITEDKTAWGHQRGAGYLKNASDNFDLGNSLSGDNSTANITVKNDGDYKFTLKTYPAGDFQLDGGEELYKNRSYFDKITVERLGDATEQKAQVETTMYIKGAKITAWGDYINANTTMVANPDNANELKLENIYLRADDEFMFASQNKDVATGELSAGNVYIKASNLTEAAKTVAKKNDANTNIKVLADGYYTFKYLVKEETLDVIKLDNYQPKPGKYYVDGSWCSWGGVKDDKYLMVQDETNKDLFVYSDMTLKEGDEVGIQYYDAATKGYNGFFSAKNLVKNEAFDVTGNNMKCKTAGTYTVTLDTYSHLITITEKVA